MVRDFTPKISCKVLICPSYCDLSLYHPISLYLIAFGKPAGQREVAPREFDVHSRWLTVCQMSTASSKVAPGTMYEPLAWQQTAAWKGTGWKRREVTQGRLMCMLSGSLREKHKRRRRRRTTPSNQTRRQASGFLSVYIYVNSMP